MRARAPFTWLARLAPNGPFDVVRQFLLFGTVYYLYRLTRGAIDTPDGTVIAFQNARSLIDIEQSLGLFIESPIQVWTSGSHTAVEIACWIYMNAQTTIVFGALVYLYLAHNERYYFVRNMLMVAMGIALVGYLVFPTAPPRFFPEWGFNDTLAQYTGIQAGSGKVSAMFNPYAAVPSMHCANAIMIGLVLAQLTKRRIVRFAWAAYPAVMFWVVVATGNHWVLDVVLGAMTAGVSYYGAALLARARPGAWAFSPAEV